ncbi:MAG: acyl-CoA thioesterase [bacterium]|nr:acyl-CoA thioesterase [bacterium]
MPEPVLETVARHRVLFADCDPMRVVYYANYFRFFEIGRAELCRSLGHDFGFYVDRGLYLAVTGASCQYRRPARYDEVLDIRAAIVDMRRARLSFVYAIHRDGELLVDGRTDHAVLDDAGRPQRIPEAFRQVVLARMPGAAQP